jgi:hypothetical protein
MKIIIYHKKIGFIDAIPDDVHVPLEWVSTVTTMNGIRVLRPSEDIEGFILPDAKNNPQFAKILRAIYDHKRELWNTCYLDLPPTTPIHEKFADTISAKFKIDLTK